jgi:transposase-like protein
MTVGVPYDVGMVGIVKGHRSAVQHGLIEGPVRRVACPDHPRDVAPGRGEGSGQKEDAVVEYPQDQERREDEKPMVSITVHCPHCGSDQVKRNGHASNGKQRYYCQSCHKQSREHPTPHAYSEERREEILRAYEERSSLRGIQRTFAVSRNTVSEWIKKSSQAASLKRNADRP